MPATIMRCGRTFRLARTHPAHAQSSGSETSSRSRSLVGYTIDMHESEFSEATGGPGRLRDPCLAGTPWAFFVSLCIGGHRTRRHGHDAPSRCVVAD